MTHVLRGPSCSSLLNSSLLCALKMGFKGREHGALLFFLTTISNELQRISFFSPFPLSLARLFLGPRLAVFLRCWATKSPLQLNSVLISPAWLFLQSDPKHASGWDFLWVWLHPALCSCPSAWSLTTSGSRGQFPSRPALGVSQLPAIGCEAIC